MANTEGHEMSELRAQLETLRRECDRSARMTAEIIAAFGESFRRERRMLRKESTGATDVVSLDKGYAVLPLGIKEQRVAVASCETANRVRATALCADASEVVTLILAFGSLEPPVRAVAGESANEPREEGATFLVRLIAGEAKDLFEIAPHADAMEFAVRRMGGQPCVVRLEIAGQALRAAATSGEGDSAPSTAGPRAHGDRPSGKGTLWKAQQLLREGRPERAMEIALAYATDAERPALSLLRATLAANDDEWLTNVNTYIEQFGIAPIRLEKTNASRFLRLAADAPRAVSGGPLVTVIMPAYNAERTLELAATSILKQSWRELELLIVDDFSPDATGEIARRIARQDPRVRVHRNSVNVGPYVSKNVALSMANGAYITCHDADDWAHPQRIEKQVAALVARGGCARACVASWLRLDEAGGFGGFTTVGRQSHDGALRLAHVTCMIEAEFMKRYVGHWDSVRFGADGEILERLERLLGEDLLRLQYLSVLSLNNPRSLTNHAVYGISKAAGLSPTRRAYRDAWRRWHATVTADGAYIEFPQLRRPFAAPDACLVRTTEADFAHADD
jgi:glycosyltransferase involved in cell wall biosynthesis